MLCLVWTQEILRTGLANKQFMDNLISAVRRVALVAAFSVAAMMPASAQRIGLKTNALYWLAATPNLGAEFRLNRHLTLDVEGACNKLTVSDYSVRAFSFTPEMRWWFSARPQVGHFVGVMAMAADYKLKLDKKNHNGDMFGAGFTYGYAFVLGKRWSMEATAGVGVAYIREKKWDDSKGIYAPADANNRRWLPFPLKLGLNFTYLIK